MMSQKIRVVRWVIGLEAVALLALLAAPGYIAGRTRQRGAKVAADLKRVVTGAETAFASTGEWPDDSGPGDMPERLKGFLPMPVRFEQDGCQIDWDHWKLSDGAEDFSPRSEFVAVSVITPDTRLARSIVEAMGSDHLHFVVGDRSTFILAGPTSTRN